MEIPLHPFRIPPRLGLPTSDHQLINAITASQCASSTSGPGLHAGLAALFPFSSIQIERTSSLLPRGSVVGEWGNRLEDYLHM